jgi:hypothetical protein
MGSLSWFSAPGGADDAYIEFQACRTRSRYDAALLLTRLENAARCGSTEVGVDRLVRSKLYFYPSGDEGLFYVLDDLLSGANVRVVWVGNVKETGLVGAQAIAENRLTESEAGD